MKLNKKPNRQEKGAPKWMVTYSDLMTLILVFFILLFSMSQIDAEKFKAVAESFQQRAVFDFYPSIVEFENPAEEAEGQQDSNQQTNDLEEMPSVSEQEEQEAQNKESMDQLVQEVDEFLKENDLEDVISAIQTDRGVVLRLQEQILFETGEANIISSGEPFLNKVGELLTNIPNHVKVEGHTDERSISTYRYPSNWELSTARAGSVIRYIVNNHDVDSSRFTATGYAATRPIAPNDSEKNWQKNRRVEIVILDPEYEEK
ncbi:flagellar motor protein MotS [Pontibacillus litoralis]|uniref:Flagellar motor protein MotS n=1 Tax=Pontibacillus litoralis JSM 072002 TaxID=1385512 RepID=A0A0A5GD61_9BACI|nr:flagellar motor protein MotS [Pontibacillus litoralis]KGX89143.1 flagellar motor protein MotS [Pontibacillus litoralis JSM 072002]